MNDESSEIRQASGEELARFGRVLYDGGLIAGANVLLDYFEAPWKWGLEYRFWTVLGRPADGDPAWDGFIDTALRGQETIRLWLYESEEAAR